MVEPVVAADDMGYKAVTYDAVADRVYYRASSLGQCITALVAQRLGMQTMEPNQMFLDKFEDGHVHEEHILKKARDQDGLRLFRLQPKLPQDEVLLRITDSVFVIGHVDGIAQHESYGVCVVDAKALSKSSFEAWARGQFEAWPHYAWQQSAYAYALGDLRRDIESIATHLDGAPAPKGQPLAICMAVKNKDSSQVRTWYYPEPPISRSEIVAKLMKVEAYAKSGDLPPCDLNDFLCPVWYLHSEKVEKVMDMEGRAEVARLADLVVRSTAASKFEAEQVKVAKAALAKLVGVGESMRVDAGRVSVYKTKNPPRFEKDRFIEDHPGVDLDLYYTSSERTEVRVTPPKTKEES